MDGTTITNTADNLNLPAIPCGLVAKSFFNDTFTVLKCTDSSCKSTTGTANLISTPQKGIAWQSDMTYKFHNIIPTTIPKSRGTGGWKSV